MSRYKAFISYSHADDRFAAWLHRRLEGFVPPQQKAYPLRPVFRDRSELSAGQLTSAIQEALGESEALVVVCSREAAASNWVQREIETFQQLQPEGLILPIIVPEHTGDTDVFPGPIADMDLLAADARADKDGRQDAFLKIAAALLAVNFDDLRRRTEQRQQRRVLGMAAGACLVAAIAVTLAIAALLAREEAEVRRQQAEDLVTILVEDVSEELGGMGTSDFTNEVTAEALEYFESIDEAEMNAATLFQRSKAIRQRADAAADQGSFADSIEGYQLALESLQHVATAEDPLVSGEEVTFEIAQTYVGRAAVRYQQGQFDQSIADSRQYLSLVGTLANEHPDNRSYVELLIDAHNNLGALAMSTGDANQALVHFNGALDKSNALVEQFPFEGSLREQQAGLMSWLSNVHDQLGGTDESLLWAESSVDALREAMNLDPSTSVRQSLGSSLMILAVRLRDVDLYQSREMASESLTVVRGLQAHDPDNMLWRSHLVRALGISIGTELELGCGSQIAGMIDEVRDNLASADGSEPTVEELRNLIDIDVLEARFLIGKTEYKNAADLAGASLVAASELLAMTPEDELSKRYYIRAAESLVRAHWLAGKEAAAVQVAATAVVTTGQPDTIQEPALADRVVKLKRASEGNWDGWPPEPSSDITRCDA